LRTDLIDWPDIGGPIACNRRRVDQELSVSHLDGISRYADYALQDELFMILINNRPVVEHSNHNH
jgi:hypothetical protein